MKLVILGGAQRVFNFGGLDCKIRKEVLKHLKIYNYLYAADIMIFGKHFILDAAVLSSTVHLCLGSGCSILAKDSNFFDFIHEEVGKRQEDLQRKIQRKVTEKAF